MTCIQHVRCEADCGGFGIAKSLQDAFQAHKTSDALEQTRHKERMVVVAIFLFLKRISQHFLQTLAQGFVCILMQTAFLFRCVYISFCFLGTAFLFSCEQFLPRFFDIVLSIHSNKICTCSNARLSCQHEDKNQKSVWTDCTIYKFSHQISINAGRIVTC